MGILIWGNRRKIFLHIVLFIQSVAAHGYFASVNSFSSSFMISVVIIVTTQVALVEM